MLHNEKYTYLGNFFQTVKFFPKYLSYLFMKT